MFLFHKLGGYLLPKSSPRYTSWFYAALLRQPHPTRKNYIWAPLQEDPTPKLRFFLIASPLKNKIFPYFGNCFDTIRNILDKQQQKLKVKK